MAEWIRSFPPASEAQIQRFEVLYGVVLPPLYRAYLMSANGGWPEPRMFFVIPDLGEKVLLGALYGLGDDNENSLSLEHVIANTGDDFPTGVIPVGFDPGGNFLLLATSGVDQEKVFFKTRIGAFARRAGKSLFLIANDIQALIESLQPE